MSLRTDSRGRSAGDARAAAAETTNITISPGPRLPMRCMSFLLSEGLVAAGSYSYKDRTREERKHFRELGRRRAADFTDRSRGMGRREKVKRTGLKTGHYNGKNGPPQKAGPTKPRARPA